MGRQKQEARETGDKNKRQETGDLKKREGEIDTMEQETLQPGKENDRREICF
jgi:hypothetical protein